MENEIKEILKELRTIRIDIEILKENILDSDSVLTAEEKLKFDNSMEEFKRGEYFSLKDLESA
jgi:hypothetical protein